MTEFRLSYRIARKILGKVKGAKDICSILDLHNPRVRGPEAFYDLTTLCEQKQLSKIETNAIVQFAEINYLEIAQRAMERLFAAKQMELNESARDWLVNFIMEFLRSYETDLNQLDLAGDPTYPSYGKRKRKGKSNTADVVSNI
mgnify:CR=1 FL=1